MRCFYKIVLAFCMCFLCCYSYAQKTKRVKGFYRYVLSEDITPMEGREIALEKARQNAIESEYGTSISHRSTSQTHVTGSGESTNFSSIGHSLVRGVWVRNIGEPEFVLGVDQNQFYIECSVKGYAREYKSAPVEFEVKLFRNGTTSQFESKDGVFKNGDKFYLSFQSPVDGYVAIYLVDAAKKTYCLLPYASDSDGKESVTHGVINVFFAPRNNAANDFIVYEDETINGLDLHCEDRMELNQLYIIFSPNSFTKAIDEIDKNGLRSLSQEHFLEWLDRCLSYDTQMSVETIYIEVEK